MHQWLTSDRLLHLLLIMLVVLAILGTDIVKAGAGG